ncbi:MAG: glycosyltransferase family 9 protein [Desulfobacterales bacterium]|jgi:ADP-heptose:LPS heptosyltransferase
MTAARLLIIHQGALGDVVLTFASIIVLRKQLGRIDIFCQGQIGKLAAKLGLIDTAYPLEAALFATLFSGRADAIIKDVIRSYTKIVVFSFSVELENAINEITDSPCVRIPPRPPIRDRIHVAEYLLQNLINGGLIKTAEAHEALSFRQRKQIPAVDQSIENSKIIIHPGSGSVRKRWPLDRFLKLAEVLGRRGLRPQFVCGPAEWDLQAEIKNQNRQVNHFSQLTDLADWMKTAGGYIGNDSGISHLAAFLGLPCVVIFGPTDPQRWTPPGPRVEVVRPELECSPCFEIEPHNCDKPVCVTDASLESVLEAFDGVYPI